MTSGELAESPAGTGVSEPISEGEGASDALLVVGRLHSTRSAAKAARPRNRRLQWVGEGGWRRWLGRERNQMSKGEEVDQFHE